APHSAGMLGLAHRGFVLRDPSRHLARFLRSNGYHTCLAGHQHLTSGDPRKLGYETVYESGNGDAADVAPNAVSFLRQAQRGGGRPFFLDVGFDETHRPFHEAPVDAGRYVAVLPGLPDTVETRQDMARFHASLRELDRGVEMVLDELEASGQAENTIVILTTDHGPAFPGMKSTLTDAGIGVGLIVRAPGMTTPGTVIDALVSQIDLYPTICDVAGLERPAWLQGYSMVPLLDGRSKRIRDEVFGEVTFHAAYEPQRVIRTDRWTYIRRFEDQEHPVLSNIDASPARDILLEHGWAERIWSRTSLFDNVVDPLQRDNLTDRPEHAIVEADLSRRLEAWMRATDDPLLAGPVPLPKGARVNRVSDGSPDDPLVDADFR
ncbi:MAG: sulfatase, partial [Thermomicrobiales bacterium]|nr:sulfatase [Thermomicrobiales bacterium]